MVLPKKKKRCEKKACQVLPSDRFGCFKRSLQGLSDLHLGDQKVTWKKPVEKSYLPENVTWARASPRSIDLLERDPRVHSLTHSPSPKIRAPADIAKAGNHFQKGMFTSSDPIHFQKLKLLDFQGAG